MQPHKRYNILAEIATGDFATVFRARDNELARDVAIKQIHPQFLSDPRQLNPYWEEAHILASLEHPNVLTIYDIDRNRGWLILELMSGTMQSRAGGKPLDLELIRMGLICGLKALEFLHKSNIIHGDVKPSNLLIDRRNWIKLGDFGLAQRATNDQGSLFKGTTRYIAPERVDPEIFGPVGPHSDLYSLGFSMYELLCGNAFESLFPGLNAFGADKQIAWMMWHAGPDRKMPQINRVLKGVPDDLAQVIERLVTKDPKLRYRDAQEAIRDLKIGMGKAGTGLTDAEKEEAEATAREEEKKKLRKRLLIAAILFIVTCTSTWLLFFPRPEPQKTTAVIKTLEGRIVQIVPGHNSEQAVKRDGNSTEHTIVGTLVVDTDEDKAHQTITIRPFDQVYFNDPKQNHNINSDQFDLDAFKKDDYVRFELGTDAGTGRDKKIINISRPIEDRGIITDLRPRERAFVLKRTEKGTNAKPFEIRLPQNPLDTKIEINGEQISTTETDPIRLLKRQDVVTAVRHNTVHSYAEMAEIDSADEPIIKSLKTYFDRMRNYNNSNYQERELLSDANDVAEATKDEKKKGEEYKNKWLNRLCLNLNRSQDPENTARNSTDRLGKDGLGSLLKSKEERNEIENLLESLLDNRKQIRREGRIVHPQSIIRIIRKERETGTIQNTDVTQKTINIKTENNKSFQLPLSDNCEVFLNGRNLVGDRRLTLADLKHGDTVIVLHDTHAVRIDAERTSKAKGTITKVIPGARKMMIRLQDKDSPLLTFLLSTTAKPTLGGIHVELNELQPTDLVKLTYDSTDPENLFISHLSAQRVTDRRRWALIIGFNAYDDRILSTVHHLGADAADIRDALIERYRVSRDQTLLINNVVRAELKSKVISFLRRMRANSELLVYYGGHAYLDAFNQPQLAAKNFRLLNTEESGLPLKWLIDAIEDCKAKEKILFLDTCHEGSGSDLKDQPASEQQILILEEDRTQPALKSVTVIVSCREGKRGQRTSDGGIFSRAVASAYRGDADKNNDQRVSLQEANEYIRNHVSRETQGSQITSIVKPGKIVPPRLSKNTLALMKKLAKKLKRRRVTSAEIASEINKLQLDGGTEAEPLLLIALAEIKLTNWKNALSRFEEIPDHVIAQQGIVWSHYQLRNYEEAINTLISLIHLSIKGLKGNEQQAVEAKRILEWVGRMREYAVTAATPKDQIPQIDAENIDDTAKAAGQQVNHYYTKGRHFVADRVEDFDDAMNDATNSAAKLTIRNKKIKLKNYVSFNLPLAISQVLQSAEHNK